MDQVVLCDTNILIEFFKGEKKVSAELHIIRRANVVLSAVTVSELFSGALNKQDLNQLVKRVSPLNVLQITPEISRIHLDLMQRYALSHNLKLPDAFIAATALHYQLPIYTLNLKDFRYIEGLALYHPS